jgi:HlyD family secretion protein
MNTPLFTKLSKIYHHNYRLMFLTFWLISGGMMISGCGNIFTKEVEAQLPKNAKNKEEKPPSVEVSTAKIQPLSPSVNYIGNTQAIRAVSLRSQVEGRLLKLNVEVGNRVTKGQAIAQLDNTLILTAISEANAQLAALQSEVTRLENEVKNAQVQVKQTEVELKQAQADAKRFKQLAQVGAVALQQAEISQTNADVAAQKVLSAQEQVRIREKAVITAQQRVKAQNATLAQVKERSSYSLLNSPITGLVLEKTTEPGNLVQPGGEIIKIGDFSQIKVVVPITELKLKEISIGQAVKVTLDAFAGQVFEGRISQISPAAIAQTRQIPVEITIPNPESKIGSGLLARVELGKNKQTVVIPENALQGDNKDTIFVLAKNGEKPTVEERKIQTGDRANNLIEITTGLKEGDKFVLRSSRPLTTGETVRLSMLSN